IAATSVKLEAGQSWSVQLKDVPLEVGANQVRLFVSNTDARSLDAGEWTITFKKTPPPRPVVEISLLDSLASADGPIVYSSAVTMQVRLTSKSPLKRLELVREEPGLLRQAMDVSKLQANPQGIYELKLLLQLASAATPSGAGAAIELSKLKPNPQGFLEAA